MAAPLSPRAVNRQTRGVKEKPNVGVSKINDEKYARPPPPVVQDPAGQRYQCGRELGKGGFAICYEATVLKKENRVSALKVALKIVKAEMGVKKMEEKFRTELQIHSRMRHPNIVEFHRAFTYGKSTYIVLELCPNGSLKDMCSKRKVLSMPEIRRFGIQICGAVKYMHAKNVIHRDLKMGNLFLDQQMNIKIGDFGLAAIYLNESDAGFVSRRTTLCGTPNYIAPEILDRKNGHDHKVDLWAIGVILYTLMVGKPPFSRQGDKNNDAVYQRVKIGDYEWPTEARNDIPAEAKDLISLLLIPEAEARPEPDEIADHAFFSMRGGWEIPDFLTPSCMTTTPSWLGAGAPRGDVMLSSAPRIQHDTFNSRCGVGGASRSDPVGDYYGQSLYQDFLLEEAAGRTPVVPLPEGTIYSWTPQRITSKTRAATVRSTSARAPARSNPSSTITTRAASATNPRLPVARSTLPIRGPNRPESIARARPAPRSPVAEESASSRPRALFGAADSTTLVDNTSANDVLSMLKDLVTNLWLCLQASASDSAESESYSALLDHEIPRPPVVVKWVDYSNKFGIGYLLENGTIGCIFQAADLPLSSIVVANVERHLSKRNKSASYPEKQQIVRKDGAMIDFFAPNNDPQQPLLYLAVHPKDYQVQGDGRLAPGLDPHDADRRQLLGLWDKFARFMTQTLGKPPDGSNSGSTTDIRNTNNTARNFVRFYQRLGNVGVWGFSDGGFQFNFPDHTKLLLARDGRWADFYHLPLDAARRLHAGQTLAKEVLDRRAVLRMPLWRMLRIGTTSSPPSSISSSIAYSTTDASAATAGFGKTRVTADVLGAVVEANELRAKVEFVRDVIRSWLKLGGLGLARPGEKVLWGGMAEEAVVDPASKRRKLDWVTIGL